MKFFIVITIFLIIAFVTCQPPAMAFQDKVNHVVDFINKFQGTKEELENAILKKMEEKAEKLPKDVPKEAVDRFIEAVANRLESKVMTGEDFKKFAAEQAEKARG